jgi:hypothetical protein
LYARHAELLPDGPARVRAAATARSIATLVGPIEPERYATAIAGDIVVVDHSFLVQATLRGPESLLRAVRAQLDLSGSAAVRIDDVLAARTTRSSCTGRTSAPTAPRAAPTSGIAW